jgi:hypothetical protein
MMTRYLYRFGFLTPAQWRANEEHGWDDESSSAVFILADSSDLALEWGRQISEQFVQSLFAADGWSGTPPSWIQSSFAHWIEPSPEVMAALEGTIPTVRYGETPQLGQL